MALLFTGIRALPFLSGTSCKKKLSGHRKSIFLNFWLGFFRQGRRIVTKACNCMVFKFGVANGNYEQDFRNFCVNIEWKSPTPVIERHLTLNVVPEFATIRDIESIEIYDSFTKKLTEEQLKLLSNIFS